MRRDSRSKMRNHYVDVRYVTLLLTASGPLIRARLYSIPAVAPDITALVGDSR